MGSAEQVHRFQAFLRMSRRRARQGLCLQAPGQALSPSSLGGGGASIIKDEQGQGMLCALIHRVNIWRQVQPAGGKAGPLSEGLPRGVMGATAGLGAGRGRGVLGLRVKWSLLAIVQWMDWSQESREEAVLFPGPAVARLKRGKRA